MNLSDKACATWLVAKEPIERKETIIKKTERDHEEIEKIKKEVIQTHQELSSKLEYLYTIYPTKETYDNLITTMMFKN